MSKEAALARLIMSTGRKKREFDLVQVYEDLKYLIEAGYSINDISIQLGISSGMLNKFLSVEKICPEVKIVIRNRTIDSVALVHNLAKFSHEDQIIIMEALSDEILTTHDVRVLAPLRKSNPNHDFRLLIQRLVDSKDRKISVLRIPNDSLNKEISAFVNSIKEIIHEDNFKGVVSMSNYFEVKISKKGEKKLRQLAKSKNNSLNELINELLK